MLLNSEIFHVSTAKEFKFRVLRAWEIVTHSLARGVVGGGDGMSKTRSTRL